MNTKKKGNSFEIKIAKRLSFWITGKEKPPIFWKIGSSGAQATITNDKESKLVGDLVAIDERGTWLTDLFVVEMKDDKRANVLDFIGVGLRKKLWTREIWNKLLNQADEAERLGWLIFHRHGTYLDYLVISDDFLSEFGKLLEYDNCLSFEGGKIYELENFLYRFKSWEVAECYLDGEEVIKIKSFHANYRL